MIAELGLSSYAFVWRCGVPGYPVPAITPWYLLNLAYSYGARLVQYADNLPLSSLPASERESFLQASRQLGISLEIGIRGIQPEALRAALQLAGQFRARLVRTLLDSPGHLPSPSEAIDLLRQAMPAFAAANVQLVIENHDRFSATVLRQIVESVSSTHLGICLDTANSLGCGESLRDITAALLPWVRNVHIKDVSAQRLPHGKGFLIQGAAPGEGLVNIPLLLGQLDRLPHPVNVLLEQWPPLLESIPDTLTQEDSWARRGFAFLQDILQRKAFLHD